MKSRNWLARQHIVARADFFSRNCASTCIVQLVKSGWKRRLRRFHLFRADATVAKARLLARHFERLLVTTPSNTTRSSPQTSVMAISIVHFLFCCYPCRLGKAVSLRSDPRGASFRCRSRRHSSRNRLNFILRIHKRSLPAKSRPAFTRY